MNATDFANNYIYGDTYYFTTLGKCIGICDICMVHIHEEVISVLSFLLPLNGLFGGFLCVRIWETIIYFTCEVSHFF